MMKGLSNESIAILAVGPRLRALETGQAALREAVARVEGLMRGLLERLSRDDPPDG